VSTRVRGHPKVLASKYRDALLQALNVSASRRLGLTLMGEALSGQCMLCAAVCATVLPACFCAGGDMPAVRACMLTVSVA
jgi:hypothetical protein